MAKELEIIDLDEEVVLNDTLQDILNQIGSTPIDEPEIYQDITAENVKTSEMVKKILNKHQLKISQFEGKEIGQFSRAVTLKVSQFKNDDGTFKTTPQTENCDLPDFEQAELLQEYSMEAAKLFNKVNSLNDGETDKLKEIGERIEEIAKKVDALIWDEICGLKKEDLNDWEQKLIEEQVKYSALDATLSSVGKSLKN